MDSRGVRASFALAMFACVASSGSVSANAAERYHARPAAASAGAVAAWLRASWAGRCFPEIAFAASDGTGTEPAFPATTPVRAIRVATWASAFDSGRLAPFLTSDVIDADYAATGDRKRVLAAAFDAARATFVFQQLGAGDVAAGFVTHLTGAPASVPPIDARRATGHDPIVLAAAPPGPSLDALRRALGSPAHVVKACGLVEYAYRETGETPVVLYAVYDTKGIPRAIVIERAAG